MNYYEKNIACIKRYRETLFEGLQELEKDKKNILEDISTIETKEDTRALILKKDTITYRLNSIYYPTKEAKQWSEQFKFEHVSSVFIMFGLGNGFFVRELLNKRKKDDIVFIYEPNYEVFRYVLENYDITDILKQDDVAITVGNIHRSKFFEHFEGCLGITNISSQDWCIHPHYNEIFKDEYNQFMQDVREHNRHALIVMNTRRGFGSIYLENVIRNLRYIRTSNRLLDYVEYLDLEIPAIILAAGPSLQSDIKEIKKLKGKAYIFAVDRILDYVLDEGLEPDFIVSVDPIKPIEYVTRRNDVNIPLICKMDSNWELLDAHKGKKVVSHGDEFIMDIYKHMNIEPPVIDPGNSVATVAFSACEQLGFKTIILAGQDLAYDGERTHVGAILEAAASESDIYVEGIDGNQVRSRWDWYEFLRWYKRKLESNTSIEVIDVKSKGAKISGTINMPIDKVSEIYCLKEFDPSKLRDIKPTFSEEDMVEVSKFIQEGYEQLDKIKEEMEMAIDLSNKQINGYKHSGNSSKKYSTRLKKISKINKSVMNMPMYRLLEYLVYSKSSLEMMKLYQPQDTNGDEILSIYKSSLPIYQAILDSIEFIKPIMKNILEEV